MCSRKLSADRTACWECPTRTKFIHRSVPSEKKCSMRPLNCTFSSCLTNYLKKSDCSNSFFLTSREKTKNQLTDIPTLKRNQILSPCGWGDGNELQGRKSSPRRCDEMCVAFTGLGRGREGAFPLLSSLPVNDRHEFYPQNCSRLWLTTVTDSSHSEIEEKQTEFQS